MTSWPCSAPASLPCSKGRIRNISFWAVLSSQDSYQTKPGEVFVVVGWGKKGQIPKIAMMGACWPGAGAGSEPGEPWICWKIKEPLFILKNKISGVRLFVLLRCWMCWKPGNTLQWTPWHGYETLHFVGAKVNFPKSKFCFQVLPVHCKPARGSC